MKLPDNVIPLTPEEYLRIENAQLRMRLAQQEQHCLVLECALRHGLSAKELAQYQLVAGHGLVRVPAPATANAMPPPAKGA